jgi:DNA-binding transcriptional MerR regulator
MKFPRTKTEWLKLLGETGSDRGTDSERVGSEVAAFHLALSEHRVTVSEIRGYLDAMETLFPETKRTIRDASRRSLKQALAVSAELAESDDPAVRAEAIRDLEERGLSLEKVRALLQHDNEDIVQFIDAHVAATKSGRN